MDKLVEVHQQSENGNAYIYIYMQIRHYLKLSDYKSMGGFITAKRHRYVRYMLMDKVHF